MDASLLILLVTALTVLHYLLVGRHRGIFTIDGVFVFSNCIMAVGTFWLLQDPVNYTPGYAAVVAVPTCIYLVASMALYLAEAPQRLHSTRNSAVSPVLVAPVVVSRNPMLLALFLLSLLVTAAYYYSVGYNVLALGIKGIFSGASADYTSLRIESYSPNRYLFPGYVNQFKNIILPTLAVVWIHGAVETRMKGTKLAAALLVGVSIFALLGTGQRGAFMLFSLAVLIFLFRLSPEQFRSRAPRLIGLFAVRGDDPVVTGIHATVFAALVSRIRVR